MVGERGLEGEDVQAAHLQCEGILGARESMSVVAIELDVCLTDDRYPRA